MPKEKLTKLEHYELLAREMKIMALAEKGARMKEVQKNAHLLMELTAKEMQALKAENIEAVLDRTAVITAIGTRLGATGKPESWRVGLDQKKPEASTIEWAKEDRAVEGK